MSESVAISEESYDKDHLTDVPLGLDMNPTVRVSPRLCEIFPAQTPRRCPKVCEKTKLSQTFAQ